MGTIVDLSNLGSQGFVVEGELDNDKAGWSVSGAGDVNGDGIGDFIVGAPDGGPTALNGYSYGAAYVVYGKKAAFDPRVELENLAAADGFAIMGDNVQDKTGFSVSSAGDLNGDGIDDILVGASQYSIAVQGSGRAYVIFGKTGDRPTLDLGGAHTAEDFIVIGGDALSDRAGFSVSDAGDFNGDGFDDIVIGAPHADGASFDGGKAYVIFGHGGSFADIADLGAMPAGAGMVLQGEKQSDLAGYSVSSAGDINGDGIDDLIVGAPQTDYGDPVTAGGLGTAYVVFGKAGPPATLNLADMTALEGFAIRGEAYDQLAFTVSTAGDVNGDGFDDIVVGAPMADDGGAPSVNYGIGAAYVLFGKAGGFGTVPPGGDTPEIDLGDPLAASDGFAIVGADDNDRAATNVSDAGDVNGDGFDDIIISAIAAEPAGAYSTGEAYVVFGKASGFGTIDLGNLLSSQGFIIQGDQDSDRIGQSVSSADVNGDGFTDLLVGAPVADVYDAAILGDRIDVGEAYVIYGIVPTTAVTRLGSSAGQTIRGGAFNDNLYGFGGDDRLDGRGGKDRLDGGIGSDNMFGGIGDDTYVVRDAGDQAFEGPGGGVDQVHTLVSHTLRTGSQVEILLAAPGSGTAAINLNGNAFANAITGNAGANRIDGRGGTDTLKGLGGNDTFLVDSNGDVVAEFANGGYDRVLASVNYVLKAGVHVEALLTASTGGTSDLRLTGNERANTVQGNAGDNILNGAAGADVLNGFAGDDRIYGGTGNDVMAGGSGIDRFYFVTALDGTANVDRMTDFAAVDAILLDRDVFDGIGDDGNLAPGAFRVGTFAQDGSDRIIYDSATGRIFYDEDGVGGAAKTLFARVGAGTELTAADFIAFSDAPGAPPPPLAGDGPMALTSLGLRDYPGLMGWSDLP